MNSVGIDVSKGKSMIAVMRPFGEVVCSPFEVPHTSSELSALARRLKSLDGETRVVMEATGNYHLPIAVALHEAGIYVSVVKAASKAEPRRHKLRIVHFHASVKIHSLRCSSFPHKINDFAGFPLCRR